MITQQTVVKVNKMDEYFNYIRKNSKALNLFFNSLDNNVDVRDIEAHFKLISKPPTITSGWSNEEIRERVEKRMKNARYVNDKDGNLYVSEDF